MESNQEQKKISSENHQGQSARSSSKRSKNRHRSKKHRQALAQSSASAQTQKEQAKMADERSSSLAQGQEKAKSDEKVQQNLQHGKAVSHREELSKTSSEQSARAKKEEEKAKPSDAKGKQEEASSKQASEHQSKQLRNNGKEGKNEDQKLKDPSAGKDGAGQPDKKEETGRLQAEKLKESVKKDDAKKEPVTDADRQKQEKAPVKEKKRRKRHGITFYIVIFTFFVVIGSAAAMASLFLSSNNAFFANIPEVELPVFTKMNVDEILGNPEYDNFRFRIEEIYSNEIEEGIVADQSPKPPKSVKENAVITLKVSKGPENITVPSVVGWNRDTAREKFKDLGLSVLIQSESDRNVAPNKVIRTNPEAGTVVQAGDVITIYVSRSISEATIVTVPNCVGLTQDSAKNQLSRLGLVGLTVIKDGSEPAGTVIGQSPSGGTKTGANDTVQLYVSNGKMPAGEGGVIGGVPAQEGQQLYPGGPMVGNADGQVVPGSVTGHIHTWQTISGTGSQVCTVCGQTR